MIYHAETYYCMSCCCDAILCGRYMSCCCDAILCGVVSSQGNDITTRLNDDLTGFYSARFGSVLWLLAIGDGLTINKSQNLPIFRTSLTFAAVDSTTFSPSTAVTIVAITVEIVITMVKWWCSRCSRGSRIRGGRVGRRRRSVVVGTARKRRRRRPCTGWPPEVVVGKCNGGVRVRWSNRGVE